MAWNSTQWELGTETEWLEFELIIRITIRFEAVEVMLIEDLYLCKSPHCKYVVIGNPSETLHRTLFHTLNLKCTYYCIYCTDPALFYVYF